MLNQAFIAELKHEAASTKRILERVPEDKFGWKPHEKSMTLGRLASHVAELPEFLSSILTMDDFDFTKGHYKVSHANTPEELMNVYQQKLDEVLQTLQNTSDEKMHASFTLRSGDLKTTKKSISTPLDIAGNCRSSLKHSLSSTVTHRRTHYLNGTFNFV